MLRVFIGLIIGIAGTAAVFYTALDQAVTQYLDTPEIQQDDTAANDAPTTPRYSLKDGLRDVHYSAEAGFGLLVEAPYLLTGEDYSTPMTSKNSLRITRTDTLTAFAESDMQQVCFHIVRNNTASHQQLDLNVYLTAEKRDALMTALSGNARRTLAFKFREHTITAVTTTEALINNTKELMFSDSDNTAADADFTFISAQQNNHAILTLAKYLSPESIPGGCTDDFDPKLFPWWDAGMIVFWPKQ